MSDHDEVEITDDERRRAVVVSDHDEVETTDDERRRAVGVSPEDEVLWHDLECGGYAEDLELWLELARAADGPVLDVGAGTGRTALELAAAGIAVTALDRSEVLLAALAQRAAERGLAIPTVVADAREAIPGGPYAAILVPMQTLQLLEGAGGRARFYAVAAAALTPGGLLAAALAEALDGFDATSGQVEPPLPDVRELGGVVYASRPVAVREGEGGATIERLREVVDLQGRRTSELDRLWLDRVDPSCVAAEAAVHGFAAEPPRLIPATDEYVGSEVVLLRGT